MVSREIVRVSLPYTDLRKTQVLSADIINAYLQAPASGEHYIIRVLDLGLDNVGKRALIFRALYGGNSDKMTSSIIFEVAWVFGILYLRAVTLMSGCIQLQKSMEHWCMNMFHYTLMIFLLCLKTQIVS